jgi:predicted ATPase
MRGTARPVWKWYNYLSTAFDLLKTLPDRPERAHQEFTLLIGLWRLYFAQSQFERARELAAQCFTLAQRLQDVRLLQEAHMAVGSTFLHLGEFVAARASFEQGIALHDSQQCRILAFSCGIDPGVVCLARVAWTLWMLGYVEQALERSREALALAQDMSHTYSLAFALHLAGIVHQCRREVQVVQDGAEAEMALSGAQGFAIWSEGSMILRGWALVQQGAIEEGIAQLRQGLDSWLGRGNDLGKTRILAVLAEADGKAGQTAEGLGVLAEALAAVRNHAEHVYEAELYRLKGELLLLCGVRGLEPEGGQSHMAEVEECFRQALEIAHRQQAKSLELRATMSLARLWRAQGRRAEARQMLTGIYGWFTEGFDTAKALIPPTSRRPRPCSGSCADRIRMPLTVIKKFQDRTINVEVTTARSFRVPLRRSCATSIQDVDAKRNVMQGFGHNVRCWAVRGQGNPCWRAGWRRFCRT